jgi:hypothetical protein
MEEFHYHFHIFGTKIRGRGGLLESNNLYPWPAIIDLTTDGNGLSTGFSTEVRNKARYGDIRVAKGVCLCFRGGKSLWKVLAILVLQFLLLARQAYYLFEESIPFPCNLYGLWARFTPSNSAECASCRQFRVRCSLVLGSELALCASFARIHKAIPTLQSEVVAASETVNRLYQELRQAGAVLKERQTVEGSWAAAGFFTIRSDYQPNFFSQARVII